MWSVIICWPTDEGFRCGWSYPSEQTDWNRNLDLAFAEEERAICLTGLSLGRSGVNSKLLPGTHQFLGDQLASRRWRWDSRPWQERWASSRHFKHSSCPGRICSAGGEWIQWIQIQNGKCKVSDLKKQLREEGYALLCKRSFDTLRIESMGRVSLATLPIRGIFLVYD